MSHVTQTLTSLNTSVPWTDYVIDISIASTNPLNIVLLLLRTLGSFGNSVFFICSAWFLLDNDKVKAKKELKLLLDVWTISVLICGIVLVVRHGNIGGKMLIRQLFPTLFANNWYISCYLLFYPAHGVINRSIRAMSQKELLAASTALGAVYILLDYIGEWLFPSSLILWVTIYVIVAYIKLYGIDFVNSTKTNVLLAASGAIGNAGIIIATDIAGTKMGFLQNKTMHWHNNCSPFILMMALGLFCLFRKIDFSSKVINYISKLSLFIYIIHENVLLRTYYRTMLWHEIYNRFGYNHVLIWLGILTVAIFAFGVVVSILYKNILERLVEKTVDKLLPILCKIYTHYEMLVMKLH